jgi:hypothetical protein
MSPSMRGLRCISCGSFFLDIEREGVGVVLSLFNSRCLVDGT